MAVRLPMTCQHAPSQEKKKSNICIPRHVLSLLYREQLPFWCSPENTALNCLCSSLPLPFLWGPALICPLPSFWSLVAMKMPPTHGASVFGQTSPLPFLSFRQQWTCLLPVWKPSLFSRSLDHVFLTLLVFSTFPGLLAYVPERWRGWAAAKEMRAGCAIRVGRTVGEDVADFQLRPWKCPWPYVFQWVPLPLLASCFKIGLHTHQRTH